jgi:hypothetical protein
MVYGRASLKDMDMVKQERFISLGYTQYVQKLYLVKIPVGKESLHLISSVSCTSNVLRLGSSSCSSIFLGQTGLSLSTVFRSGYIHTMSGTALFPFFFFFFFVHSAASPAGISMYSCLLLCSLRCLSSWHFNVQLSSSLFTPLPLQLAFQCSAVTRPFGTRIKRVENNTKLACASGR